MPVKRKETNLNLRLRSTISVIERFQVELEPSGCKIWYRAGQNIKGKVIIKNSEQIVCHGIRVALEGFAEVGYLSNNLLNYDWATVFVLGGQSNPRPHTVKASTHEFPFVIPIRKIKPFPGTLKAPHGKIVYKVTAYINSVAEHNSTTVSEIIKMKSYLNLKTISQTENPVMLNGIAKLSPSNDDIKFSFQLHRAAFIPWEQIPFKITLIDPKIWENIPSVCVSLLKRLIFKSDVSTRCIKTELSISDSENSDWELVDKETAEWKNSFNVPEEAKYPTYSGDIIKCTYSVKLEIKMANSITPFICEVPITVGTTRQNLTSYGK